MSEVIDTAFAIEDRAGVALGPIVVNGASRRSPTASPTTSDAIAARRGGAAIASSREREADDLAHAAAFRAERHARAARADRPARASGCRCRRSSCRSCSRPTSASPQIDALADALTRGIERAVTPPRASPSSSTDQPRRRSAAAAAASARRRPPRCSRSKARGTAATRASSRSTPRSDSPTRSGSSTLSDTPSEIDREPLGRRRHRPRPTARSSALMLDTKSTFDQLVTRNAGDARAGAAHPRQHASTATSPARSAARRNTWRWRSCTSCTTTATSTSSSSTRRRRVTRSTSSTRRAGCMRLLDNRIFRLLMMPTRAYLQGRERRGADVPAHGRAGRRLRGDRRRRRVLPRVRRAWKTGFRERALAVEQLLADARRPRSCSSRRPAATRWRRRRSSPSGSPTHGQKVAGADREPRAPVVRRRSARRAARRGRRACAPMRPRTRSRAPARRRSTTTSPTSARSRCSNASTSTGCANASAPRAIAYVPVPRPRRLRLRRAPRGRPGAPRGTDRRRASLTAMSTTILVAADAQVGARPGPRSRSSARTSRSSR